MDLWRFLITHNFSNFQKVSLSVSLYAITKAFTSTQIALALCFQVLGFGNWVENRAIKKLSAVKKLIPEFSLFRT